MHTDADDPPTQPMAVVAAPPTADSGDAAMTPPPTPLTTPDPASSTAALPRSPWSFVDVFAGLGVVLLASTLIGAAVRLTDLSLGSATLLVSALPVWIGLLGTAIWACRRHGIGNPIVDLALRIRWMDLLIGLGAGLGLRVVIGIWTVICYRLTGQQPQGNLQDVLGNSGLGRGVWLVVNMLVIGLIGPVIEEIFFRGVGLRGALASLLRRTGTRPKLADPRRRVRIAVGATALVFALLHVSEVGDAVSALALIPGLFVAGLVLGWLTIRSGRLGPAVVTHVVFNGVAVIALLTVS